MLAYNNTHTHTHTHIYIYIVKVKFTCIIAFIASELELLHI